MDAVCEGADPRDSDAAWPVPDRFTERGEPPVLTLTDPGRPGGGAIEVSRGRVLLRFQTPDATLTSEVSDPPQPPANHPLVIIRRRADGAPDVTVTEGRARDPNSRRPSLTPPDAGASPAVPRPLCM